MWNVMTIFVSCLGTAPHQGEEEVIKSLHLLLSRVPAEFRVIKEEVGRVLLSLIRFRFHCDARRCPPTWRQAAAITYMPTCLSRLHCSVSLQLHWTPHLHQYNPLHCFNAAQICVLSALAEDVWEFQVYSGRGRLGSITFPSSRLEFVQAEQVGVGVPQWRSILSLAII